MTAYWCTAQDRLMLSAALAAAGLEDGAVGFLNSATEHHVVRLANGRLSTVDGLVELDRVFAARVFDTDRELRWTHISDGIGDAVVLTEQPFGRPGWTDRRIDVTSTADGGYALWGRRFEPSGTPGWARAIEGRIGWLDLPTDPPRPSPPGQSWPGQYVRLDYREYRGADEFGNVSVVDERLIGLRLTEPTTGGAR